MCVRSTCFLCILHHPYPRPRLFTVTFSLSLSHSSSRALSERGDEERGEEEEGVRKCAFVTTAEHCFLCVASLQKFHFLLFAGITLSPCVSVHSHTHSQTGKLVTVPRKQCKSIKSHKTLEMSVT